MKFGFPVSSIAAVLAVCAVSASAQTLNIPTPADFSSGNSRAVVGMQNGASTITNLGNQITNLSTQVTNIAAQSASSATGSAFPWVNYPVMGAVASYTCTSGSQSYTLFVPVAITNYTSQPSAAAVTAGLTRLRAVPGMSSYSCSVSNPSLTYTAGVTAQRTVEVRSFGWGSTLATSSVLLPNGDLAKSVGIGSSGARVFPAYSTQSTIPVSLGFSFQSLFPSDFLAMVDVPASYYTLAYVNYSNQYVAAAYPPGGSRDYRFSGGGAGVDRVCIPEQTFVQGVGNVPGPAMACLNPTGASPYGELIAATGTGNYNITSYSYMFGLTAP